MIAMLRVGRCGLTPLIFGDRADRGAAGLPAAPAPGDVALPYGQPPVWSEVRSSGSATPAPSRPRSAARCRCPVDYANPRGAQAQVGGDPDPGHRSPDRRADGQPRRPGRLGRRHRRGHGCVVGDNEITPHGSIWSASIRAGSAIPRPQVRCRTDAEFDAYRREPLPTTAPPASPTSRRSTAAQAQNAWTRWGANSWPTSAPRRRARDMDVVRAGAGRDADQLSRVTPTAPSSAPPTPRRFRDRVRAMVLDGAVDPRWTPSTENVRQMASSRRRSTTTRPTARARRTARWAPTRPRRSTATTRWSIRWCSNPGRHLDPRGLVYQDAITGTVNALYTPRYWKFLDQRAARAGAWHRRRGPAAAGRRLPGPRRRRALPEPAGRVHRDPLRRLRALPPIRRMGGGRPADPAGRPVHELRAVHRVRAARRVRVVAGAADVDTLRGRVARARARSSSCPPPTIRRRPYQAGVDLARQMDASLITFDGTQHTVVFKGDACVDSAVVNYSWWT